MKKSSNILFYLICMYIFVLSIFPSKFNFKGIPFNGDIILAIIILVYFIKIFISKNTMQRFINGIRDFFTKWNSLFMLLWIGMMFISIIYATDKRLALQESARISTYAVLVFIIKYEITKKKYLDGIIYSTTITCIIVGLVGIYQYFQGLGLKHVGKYDVVQRITSTIENSNNLGAYFVLIIFPFILLAIKEKNKIKKIFFMLTVIISLLNIILSFSRNAWLALIIGYITLIFVYNFKLIYGAILGSGVALCIPTISHRLKEIGDLSQNLSRISLWEIAIKMIKDKPLLGVGNGNYRTLYIEYYKKIKRIGDYKAHEKFHPHNAYLKAQCELGIIGSVSLIGFLVTSFLKVNKFSNKINDNFYKYFYKGFTASVVAFMFMNVIDNFFSAPKVVAFFFIFLAVCHSYEYNLEEKNI
ncbi:O-antigen ligase family protein [Haloimpatiens lingqiaonensis]|uniref:O-antigen ligase family protein n=1 Tax=Haloimpatiens lingqiaonensis TaxID=1380675 RepID=UPI0010FEC4AA|nr:O-antigen ligase family protein [Haloimpatiens lingqiaonensis]